MSFLRFNYHWTVGVNVWKRAYVTPLRIEVSLAVRTVLELSVSSRNREEKVEKDLAEPVEAFPESSNILIC